MQDNIIGSWYCKDCGIRHPVAPGKDGECPKAWLDKNLPLLSKTTTTAVTGQTKYQEDYTEMYNEIIKAEELLFNMEQKLKEAQTKFYQMRLNIKVKLKNPVS